jgi:bacteriophage HK97-gp10 putative tail-component
MGVELNGFDKAQAEMAAAPGRLRLGLFDATKEITKVMADAVRTNVPVRKTDLRRQPAPGQLLAGVRTRVQQTADGATGRVYTKVRYASFVERGTARHGGPQWPFARGEQETRAQVQAIFDGAVDEVTRSI